MADSSSANMTPTAKPATPSPASVLLVDDVRANLVALEAVLEPLGLRIVCASSGAEALARAAEEDFAIVLMDVQMPVLDGYETTRVLHQRLSKNVPVIFVTAIHHDREHLQRGYAVGGVDYLSKPIDPDVLKAKVQSFVELFRRDQIIRQQEQQLRERELQAAAAESASRAKDQFLRVISHELRTPLNAVVGWAEALDAGRLDAAQTSQAIKTILRNSRAQSIMIDELVAFSEMVAGRLALHMEPVDLAEVVREVVDSMQSALDDKQLEVKLRILDTAPIRGEAARLKQIVLKLIANAIKFSPAGNRIEVELESGANDFRLTVKDHGVGIPQSYLPYVFEGFRQADGSYARPHAGLGIGLALARKLVELHGGSIRAESAGEGRGTGFTVRLPRADRAPAEPAAAKSAGWRAVLQRLTILLVEDDPDALDMMGQLLAGEGAKVLKAASASDALWILEQQSVDVVVSDLSMPGEDGFSLMRKIGGLERARHIRIPVIAWSAHTTDQEVRDKTEAAGFAAYVAKPCPVPKLCEAIVSVVDARD